jgi:hypothetical protein
MQIKTKKFSCHRADSKPVKQEVNSTVILPPLVFPDSIVHKIFTSQLTKFFVKAGAFHSCKTLLAVTLKWSSLRKRLHQWCRWYNNRQTIPSSRVRNQPQIRKKQKDKKFFEK